MGGYTCLDGGWSSYRHRWASTIRVYTGQTVGCLPCSVWVTNSMDGLMSYQLTDLHTRPAMWHVSGCRLHDKSKVWKPCSTTPRALIMEAFSWGNASTFYCVVAFVEIAQAHGCHTCGLGIKSFSKVSMLVLGRYVGSNSICSHRSIGRMRLNSDPTHFQCASY